MLKKLVNKFNFSQVSRWEEAVLNGTLLVVTTVIVLAVLAV